MKLSIMVALFTLAVGGGWGGCNHNPTPAPRPPTATDGAAPTPDTCAAVCAHGSALGCKWAETTPGGHTCLEVCRNASEGGPVVWDLHCRSTAPTCDESSCQ